MFMLKKILAENTELHQRYSVIRGEGLSTSAYCRKTLTPWFDVTYIYPLKDPALIENLLFIQNNIRYILNDDSHFYQSAADFHISCHCFDEGDSTLADSEKELRRTQALQLFDKHAFIDPQPYFYGGCAADKAVIIHGYDNNRLNRDRELLVRQGLDNQSYTPERQAKLFPIYPDIVHISLIRFLHPVPAEKRSAIDALLAQIDFGETTLPEIGLYEFSVFGVFSTGTLLATKPTI